MEVKSMAAPEKMLMKLGITGMVAAILTIVFGILVIVFPDLIAWLVGIYLIVVGLIDLIGHLGLRKI